MAEELLSRKLKSQLPAGAFLAAKVMLQSHEDFYEEDLVVGLSGARFVVIEVKGGQVEHRDVRWWRAPHNGMKWIDPAG